MNQLDSLALKFSNEQMLLLDQKALPLEENWLVVRGPEDMISYIKSLQVRGAPLIGVAAALCLAQWARQGASYSDYIVAAKALREARPTAVNLMYAIDKLLSISSENYTAERVFQYAKQIFDEDVQKCEGIASNGVELISKNDGVLTICNTGGLATSGIGTAFGILRRAHEDFKNIHVYAAETRPLLQGGRLTAWELAKCKIPGTLICDSMAATLMAEGKIQRVFVGADRIARNGDFANKIGTYALAVLAHHHKIPFYVAAPTTTLDITCESGKQIPIEQRSESEVRGVQGTFGNIEWAPKDFPVFNPAFDVTPAELVAAWVFDKAVVTQADIKKNIFTEWMKG